MTIHNTIEMDEKTSSARDGLTSSICFILQKYEKEIEIPNFVKIERGNSF